MFINIGKFFQSGGTDYGFWPTPKADLTVFYTHSGLKIYAPIKGEQCWDSPLPCAPYPDRVKSLRLRRNGDLASGFLLEKNAQ